MKRKINKIVSLILVFCIMISLVTVTGISANAATTDEAIAGVRSGDFSYLVQDGYARILDYYGTDTELVIPSTIDGYTVRYIGGAIELDYSYETDPITSAPITSITFPDTVTEIGVCAFRNCESLTHINIPDSVTAIGDYAFENCDKFNYVILGKNVVYWGYESFNSILAIYVPKNTDKSFSNSFDFSNLFSDIYYEGSEDEWANIAPAFIANKPWINVHYNCPNDKPVGFASVVSDDFTLNLTNEKGNIQSGEIVLQPGTYQFNIHKGDMFNVLDGKNILGYNKTINDSTSGSLTCKATYKSKITLVATGGTYNFAFNTQTNGFSITRNGDIPNVYLTSSGNRPVHLTLKPVNGTNISVGSIYLKNNGHRFKLIKNGIAFGCEKITALTQFSISKPITLSTVGNEEIRVYPSGGIFTFTFNNDTNEISAREIIHNEAVKPTNNIHVTGADFSLDLDDNNGESDLATGTITLKNGVYSFKVYNRGVACGSNSIYFDKGTRTLNPNFMLPSVLYASGGKYKFTFEKSTGRLFIHRA